MKLFTNVIFLLWLAGLSAKSGWAQPSVVGLEAWYRFEGNTLDSSPNGRDAIPFQTMSYTAGASGQGIVFDGQFDFLTIQVPVDGSADFTIGFWVRLAAINPGYTDWQEFLTNQAEGFAFGVDNSLAAPSIWHVVSGSPGSIQAGTLCFMVLRKQGAQVNLFLDGQSVASATVPVLNLSELTCIGQWIPNAPSSMDREPLGGMMDECFIYTRALADWEIEELFVSPSGSAGTLDVPTGFQTVQAFPNPFNPSTRLAFTLSETSRVNLEVYNLRGQRVATLVDGLLSAGPHDRVFDGTGLSSGIYFYRLEVEQSANKTWHDTGRLILER